jgi:polysaccharide pyruvyl transferase WcaK-like protein
MTYQALVEHGVRDNVQMFPDSAFVLDAVEDTLPQNFILGETVGINLSPRVGLSGPNHEACFAAYCKLIEYILKETQMNIALIPHVVAASSDDRIVLKMFYDKYKDSRRICIIEDASCEVIKGAVKRCRFVVAARTHCSIAAYSTGIPTMVIGYSVKSKGIAKDLFGSYEHYVIPVENINTKDMLVKEFKWMMQHEDEERNILAVKIPQYVERLSHVNEIIESINL